MKKNNIKFLLHSLEVKVKRCINGLKDRYNFGGKRIKKLPFSYDCLVGCKVTEIIFFCCKKYFHHEMTFLSVKLKCTVNFSTLNQFFPSFQKFMLFFRLHQDCQRPPFDFQTQTFFMKLVVWLTSLTQSSPLVNPKSKLDNLLLVRTLDFSFFCCAFQSTK